MITTNPLLSVCIPTFNRADTLKDLIDRILATDSSDFDIVVTDNVSTDNTKSVLSSYSDPRLKTIRNTSPIPALNNMIEALFNADGKYALYCNDRDLITGHGLISLIDLLKKGEYSFVYTTPKTNNNKNDTKVFDGAFHSLTNHRCGYHPTGMVFNMEIAKKNLCKEDYFKYLRDQNTYCFLMRDLFPFGPSAIIDNGCWMERPRVFLSKNKSGTVTDKNLFFYPDLKLILAQDTLDQIRSNENYQLNDNQFAIVCSYTLSHYGDSIASYKINMMSRYMTNHYGISRRFISTVEMIRIIEKYHSECVNYLKKNSYPLQIISSWESSLPAARRRMILMSIKTDLLFLMHILKHEEF